MHSRFVVGMAILTNVIYAASAAEPLRFDEMEQIYAYDDGGTTFKNLPDLCPSAPKPHLMADRSWGGSVRIRVSGRDASVIEETYFWHAKWAPNGRCLGVTKSVSVATRIAKNEVLYEKVTDENRPVRRSQRAMKPGEVIYVVNVQVTPKLESPDLQKLGDAIIAGQPCRRIAPKSSLLGAGIWNMCILLADQSWPQVHYLQPLDLETKARGGLMLHGRTSLLRYGARGSVFPLGSIKAPW